MKNITISFGIVFIYVMLFLFGSAKPVNQETKADLNKASNYQYGKSVISSEKLPIVMTKKD